MRIRNRSGRGARALAACIFAATALTAGAATAQPTTVTALTTGGKLVTFASSAPGTLLSTVTVTGLQPAETLLGIDYRPRTGQLYGLGNSSRLYVIDVATGVAFPVADDPFTPALDGTSFGFDFNPTVDRIRVVSDTDQNLRLHPDLGTVAGTDTALNYTGGTPADPNVVASAYTNNFAGATATTLYGIDSATDKLAIQNPPNDGVLTEVGSLTPSTPGATAVDTSGVTGFDILEGTNAAFASLTAPGATTSTLQTINLTTGAATAVGAIGGTEAIVDIALPTTAVSFVALTNDDKLVRFSSGAPHAMLATVAVSGLQPTEKLLAIDFRPRTGQLYGLGSLSRLYTVDPTTGVATAVGPAFTPALNGTAFGFDFNPTVDRIRIVSNADQNLRLHPDTGAVAGTDTALTYTGGTPADPNVVASAYTNNFAGAVTTQLFGIDSATNTLVLQDPPNGGVLTAATNPLGVDTNNLTGFDIVEVTGAAFASLTAPGAPTSTLYTINLATGVASIVGTIGASTTLKDLAIPTTPPSVFALTDENELLRVASGAPDVVLATVPLSGLQPSEDLLAIDFRPRTGQLYGLGSTSRLYTINPTTGAATQVGTAPFTPALNGTAFGFDFNPTVDRIRVVSNADQNLRLHPDTGAVAGTDTALTYTGGTPADPNVVASAYTNNFAGATTTELFGIDSAVDTLVLQDPPNGGVLTTRGSLGAGINTGDLAGFDIVSGTGAAFVSLTAPAATSSNLYTIRLDTGATTLVGAIGGGVPIRDIALNAVATLCTGSTRIACDPCLVCDDTEGCVAPTDLTCEEAFPGKATLTIVDKTDDAKDALTYKWLANDAVPLSDFGSPTTASDYQLCVFDAAQDLKLSSKAPAGGTCKGKPCWAAKKTGFAYTDAKELTPDGLANVVLKAGAKPKQAAIAIKGKGSLLQPPTLPLTGPVTVRVQRSDGPTCFEATFTSFKKNEAGKLTAKSD